VRDFLGVQEFERSRISVIQHNKGALYQAARLQAILAETKGANPLTHLTPLSPYYRRRDYRYRYSTHYVWNKTNRSPLAVYIIHNT